MRARTVGVDSGFSPILSSIDRDKLVDLAFLDVDKEKARQTLVAGEVEFADKICLQRLDRQHDKRAEPDGKQDDPRLVAGPVKRIDRLPTSKTSRAPSIASEAASARSAAR